MEASESAFAMRGDETSHAQYPRLLDLPAELQLYIFELVVIRPQPINVTKPLNSAADRNEYWYMSAHERWVNVEFRLLQPPALARVCRDIRHDALDIFYKRNNFRAGYGFTYGRDEVMIPWLQILRRSNYPLQNLVVVHHRAKLQGEGFRKACMDELTRLAEKKGLGSIEVVGLPQPDEFRISLRSMASAK